jgi:small-conductance mechanosensitive channel
MPTQLSPDTIEYIYAGLSAIGGVLVMLVLTRLIRPLLLALAHRSESDLEETIIGLLWPPLQLALLLGGVYVGLWQLSSLEAHMPAVTRAVAVIGTVIGFYAVLRLLNGLTTRYIRVTQDREEARRVPYMGVIRKLANIVLIALFAVLVLDQLDYKITPLLTSLGIAGVAVALALQDTLSNLFAGFYMLFDRPLRPGDYVKLETGEEGFVTEIGWRNTKIRPWANNAIIIPNAKLAQSVIVNHMLPEQRQRVYVSCGVDYDSDLEHVERVAVEVAKEVMARVEGSDWEYEPVVRYKEFGDSNINFLLVLQVTEFDAQYQLLHECIKALHRRFKTEGIEISWPVRKLVPAGPFVMSQPSAAAD